MKPENLVVSHAVANMAPKQRRRTYRAHGRISAYMACPAHFEVTLSGSSNVAAAKDAKAPRLTARRAAQLRGRVKVGGGN